MGPFQLDSVKADMGSRGRLEGWFDWHPQKCMSALSTWMQKQTSTCYTVMKMVRLGDANMGRKTKTKEAAAFEITICLISHIETCSCAFPTMCCDTVQLSARSGCLGFRV